MLRRYDVNDEAVMERNVKYDDIKVVDGVQCSDCQRIFTNIASMRRHVSQHDGETPIEPVKARKLFHDGQMERFEEEGNLGVSFAIGLAIKRSVPIAGSGAIDESARVVSHFSMRLVAFVVARPGCGYCQEHCVFDDGRAE